MQSIKEMLEDYKYAVVVPEWAQRINPEENLDNADTHIKPHPDKTVFVLTESVEKG